MVHRTQRGTGFTLIYGDVNPGNILVPHEGDRSPEGERWGRVHYALTVPRETLKTAISNLREHRSEVYGLADIRWMRSRAYYFFDPDGNLLEFWSPEIGDTRCRGRRCGIGWVEWADPSRDGFPPRAWKLADTDAALADTADHQNHGSLLIGQGFLDDLLHLRGLHH